MSTDIIAIILGAGESRRMGLPKLMLPWGKTSVLGQVVSTLVSANIETILVITGAHQEEVEVHVHQLARNYPVYCVYNPDYKSGGMLSSITCGLQNVILSSAGSVQEGRSAAALITLGDQPQIRQKTVHAIINAFKQHGSLLVVPSYRNRRGHPWLIARPLWDQVLNLPASMSPRRFLQDNNHRITYIPSDESILQDLDTPDDYQHYQP